MVSHITGRTPHEEASSDNTYDVMEGVRRADTVGEGLDVWKHPNQVAESRVTKYRRWSIRCAGKHESGASKILGYIMLYVEQCGMTCWVVYHVEIVEVGRGAECTNS